MARDPNREPVPAVGLCSILFDGREGTPAEPHIVFVDLDSKKCLAEPAQFRADLRRVGQKHAIKTWYLWETQKGVHVVAFELMSRQQTERVEEDLEQWGGDGFHRFMGYVNGGTVLRITPKAGEGQPCKHAKQDAHTCMCYGTGWTGPQFIGTFPGGPRSMAWSEPHWHFFAELTHQRQGIELPRPAGLIAVNAGELRLEAYRTTQTVTP